MLTWLWDLQRAGGSREGTDGFRLEELTQLGLGRSTGIQGKRRSTGQILTEEEVLMLVVVRQVLQLLLAILQDREEKAQAWITTLTSKTRFSAILLYLLPGEF